MQRIMTVIVAVVLIMHSERAERMTNRQGWRIQDGYEQ